MNDNIREKLNEKIKELESDINYFKNIEFTILASKFERDLELVNMLLSAFEKTAVV